MAIGCEGDLPVAPESAEWVKFFETDSANFYYDPIDIKREGDRVRTRVLFDLKKPNKLGDHSYIGVFEFDCKEELRRLLSYVTYAEQMGGGEIVPNEVEERAWETVEPDNAQADLMHVVCSR